MKKLVAPLISAAFALADQHMGEEGRNEKRRGHGHRRVLTAALPSPPSLGQGGSRPLKTPKTRPIAVTKGTHFPILGS